MKALVGAIIFGVASFVYQYVTGRLSLDSLRQNAWDVILPYVLIFSVLVSWQVIVAARKLLREIRADASKTSPRLIVVAGEREPSSYFTHPAPPYYQARVFCMALLVLTGVGIICAFVIQAARFDDQPVAKSEASATPSPQAIANPTTSTTVPRRERESKSISVPGGESPSPQVDVREQESQSLAESIGRDVDALISEGKSIELDDLEFASKVYDKWIEKCLLVLTRIDGKLEQHNPSADYRNKFKVTLRGAPSYTESEALKRSRLDTNIASAAYYLTRLKHEMQADAVRRSRD